MIFHVSMFLTWSSKRFALYNVSMELWFTSDSNKLTSAEKCGATCWLYQLTPPSKALNWVFSRSSVGA